MDKPIELDPETIRTIVELLENPAADAMVRWENVMKDDRPEEFQEWEEKLDKTLAKLGSKYCYKTLKRYHA